MCESQSHKSNAPLQYADVTDITFIGLAMLIILLQTEKNDPQVGQ